MKPSLPPTHPQDADELAIWGAVIRCLRREHSFVEVVSHRFHEGEAISWLVWQCSICGEPGFEISEEDAS